MEHTSFSNRLLLLQRSLLWALVFLCFGMVVKMWRGDVWSSFLFMHGNWSDANALIAEKVLSICLFLYAILCLLYPGRVSAFPLFVFFLLDSILGIWIGGAWFSEWQLLAHMGRTVVPMAFHLSNRGNVKLALIWMRWGLTFTFFVHGIEAWQSHPNFIDYIIGFSRRSLSEAEVKIVLKSIAVIDVIAAIGLFYKLQKPAIIWMLIWGFLTALIRVWEGGWIMYPEMFVRLPHALLAYGVIVSSEGANAFRRACKAGS